VNRLDRSQGLESSGRPLGDSGEEVALWPQGAGVSDPLPGRFVVLEGIDGCGKTTQLERLGQWLPTSGLMPAGARLVTSREPGGTPLGRSLRETPAATLNCSCMPPIAPSMWHG
jgi:hypothetical protein